MLVWIIYGPIQFCPIGIGPFQPKLTPVVCISSFRPAGTAWERGLQLEPFALPLLKISRTRSCLMMQGRLRPNSLELYRLYKIVAEDGTQSARITFQGSPTQQLNVGQDVIVSFPGVHGYAWNILTSGSSTFLTTCIFLMKKLMAMEFTCRSLILKPWRSSILSLFEHISTA